ncbi:PR-1-like protein [Byssothecium circinans]|uniref:PR-1-like protein n=1 Tax=Byssothecium circinans TaxID=147558 RepID=A0A6A5UAY4_9PLEO|nr:PR-1-like protein [Byssothecium circinans]
MKLFAFLALAVARAVVAAPAALAMDLPAKVARHLDTNVPTIDDPKFIKAIMDAHWYWRWIHCAQELQWDHNLAQKALNSVQACTEKMHHDVAGSNLSGVSPAPEDYDTWLRMARDCTHGWHEEETKYPYGSPNMSGDLPWLHFTQMVWRDTSRIGCALANCGDVTQNDRARVYCFYENGGNNIADGQFEKNVWPPVCNDPSRKVAENHYGF